MSLEAYKIGLSEQYQGEVIGEVAINCLLQRFDSPWQQYLLGTALQLETETKARLRPVVAQLDISIIESEESREAGMALSNVIAGMDWQAAMRLLAQAIEPYVEKYHAIAQSAPPDFRELADSMFEHERLICRLWEYEARGEGESVVEEIASQLAFPLPKPA